jgi:hypothetical protein
MKTRLLLYLFPFLAATFAHGSEVSLSVDIHFGRVPPPPPPEIIVLEPAGPPGPPPWAPASGLRRNRVYYYYPGTDVYFRPADRMWFYLEGSSWSVGASLPDKIRVDFTHSVSLTMETDRPYLYHTQVRTYYPADYFVAKVKLKDRDDDRPGNSGKGGPPPGRGRGRGRGNGS